MITDAEALALCCFEEANLEPDEGVAAVARVVLNRTQRCYQSDGTIQGTIFHPGAFSWTQYERVGERYTKVAFNGVEVAGRATRLLAQARAYNARWGRRLDISGRVEAGRFSGPRFDRLTPDVVLYDNLDLTQPDWAIPPKLAVKIGRHSFFHA
ncbi:MAG: cell wall hydrolase [Caulobacteraceae bacterium]|nr:cell wall hydrolase [Caulobacteraceae bacterium]